MPASSSHVSSTQPHSVLMVSDFFPPNPGGVESHIYHLSQHLLSLGLKVVVATHAYKDHCGIHYLENGLKVYYLPRLPFYQQSTFPTIFGSLPQLRYVLLRERITLLHAHQAFSTLALEACLHARAMGLKVVFTDHSLFGFADPASVVTNKLLKCVLADVHRVICVSHTSKENTVLRACLPLASVYVIPNAVDAFAFLPRDPTPWPSTAHDPITIVALSRLVYRKGIDILAVVLPHMCARHPHVSFIIGGDGPKRQLLEKVVEDHGLHGRVQLRGTVPHAQARDFMAQGHIFVNASLTEAFCMALLEAASVGLLVVSTAVGGVPEVLPSDMMLLADPSPQGLLAGLEQALDRVQHVQPAQQHARVAGMYCWQDVARRTCAVYNSAAACKLDDSLPARLARYTACGRFAGALFCTLALLLRIALCLLNWLMPHPAQAPGPSTAACTPTAAAAPTPAPNPALAAPSPSAPDAHPVGPRQVIFPSTGKHKDAAVRSAKEGGGSAGEGTDSLPYLLRRRVNPL